MPPALVNDINIDRAAPSISVSRITEGSSYPLGAVPATSCTATDTLSGIDGACSGSTSGGNTAGVRAISYTATAKDQAGNVTTKTVHYTVTSTDTKPPVVKGGARQAQRQRLVRQRGDDRVDGNRSAALQRWRDEPPEHGAHG